MLDNIGKIDMLAEKVADLINSENSTRKSSRKVTKTEKAIALEEEKGARTIKTNEDAIKTNSSEKSSNGNSNNITEDDLEDSVSDGTNQDEIEPEIEEEKVYCLCKKAYDETKPMLFCKTQENFFKFHAQKSCLFL